jgi:hypothetical protein
MHKIKNSIIWMFYGMFCLFFGELLMLSYSKSTIQLFYHNSQKSKHPDAYILIQLIFFGMAHFLVLALNITVFVLTYKYL